MNRSRVQGSRRPSEEDAKRFIELIRDETSGQDDGRGSYR